MIVYNVLQKINVLLAEMDILCSIINVFNALSMIVKSVMPLINAKSAKKISHFSKINALCVMYPIASNVQLIMFVIGAMLGLDYLMGNDRL